jgi:hypothetical protein
MIQKNYRCSIVSEYKIYFAGVQTVMIRDPSSSTEPEIDIPDDISEIAHEEPSSPRGGQKTHPLLGGVHLNYIMYYFIPLLIFACLYTYHMAVSSKQELPFPHTTITDTACHYPQDVVFRWLMLPAGSFIVLLYYIVFRWLGLEKQRGGFPFSTEQWLYKWATASVLGFYCAIGTIDGAGYPDLHTFGAVFFFIALFVVAGAVTMVMREMHNWDPKLVSRKSMLAKTVVFGYIVLVTIYCIVGGIAESIPHNDSDVYEVII